MAALQRLLGTALEILRLRLELFGTELEREKLRLFDVAWRAALGLLLLGVALIGAFAFVVMLFWEGYRLPALGVMTLGMGAGGAWLLLRSRSLLHADNGGPFALTLGELQRDGEALAEAVANEPAGGTRSP